VANEDLFAQVRVVDKGPSGLALPGRTSDILVRIPFKVAVSVCGSQNPTYRHIDMFQRFTSAALDAKGKKGATNITQKATDVVQAIINPSHLGSPNWEDKSGVEAWLLPPTKAPVP
jgi:hypothetical protein